MINKGYVDKTSGYREIGEVVVLTAVPFSGYVFDHWEGDVDPLHIHDNPLTIVMDSNKTVEAEFEVQKFSINITTSGDGTTDPTIPLLVEYGTNQTINFIPGTDKHVNSVVVDTVSVGAPSYYTFTNVKANHTLDVEFTENSIGLRVLSLWGTSIPSIGFVDYNNGDTVNCSMSTPIVTDLSNSQIRYVCTGWIGTGDCPASGSGLSTSFIIHQYSEITWQWKTQYYVNSQSSGNGSVTDIDGWYDSGVVVHVIATPDPRCTFLNWTGDVPEAQKSNATIDVTIDSPKVFIANFQAQTFPVGGIVMWGGSAGVFDGTGFGTGVLSGWALCNGNNGTPDLKGKFIVGYSEATGDVDYNTIGKTGGEKTHTLSTAELPSHNHSGSSDSQNVSITVNVSGDISGNTGSNNRGHTHSYYDEYYPWQYISNGDGSDRRGIQIPLVNNGRNTGGESQNHTHSFSGSFSGSGTGSQNHSHTITVGYTGSGTAHENRPPYYTLAYIMKL